MVEAISGEALSSSHLPYIAKLLVTMGGGLSEHNAANLFLYRYVHHYRFIDDALPRIHGRTYDGQNHILPLFPLNSSNWDAAYALLGNDLCLYPLPESVAASLPGDLFRLSSNADDSDYVYESASLASLDGRRLKTKRSQARQFSRQNPADRPLDDTNIVQALDVLDRWVVEVDQPWRDTDAAACREAIENHQHLGLTGMILHSGVDDCAVGLIIGGPLPDGSMAIQFAKTVRSAVGAFPYMISRFAEIHGGAYPKFNFEQDMGKPGFRQAKRSFAPICQYVKFRASPIL